MSFDLFVAGPGKFHYERKNMLEGSDYNLVKLIEKLGGIRNLAQAGVTAADAKLEPKGVTDYAEALAHREFLHMMKNSVDILAMCSGAKQGWIAVSSREINYLWADTVTNAKYHFSPGNDPGTEFAKAVLPSLKETDMQNWGVFRAIAMAISKYSSHVSDTSTPKLHIQLSK